MFDAVQTQENSFEHLKTFQERIFKLGQELYRDLPWRNVSDPYAVWISEVMLQQTQVVRVLSKWELWMNAFPTVHALASASTYDLLNLWQGMGYNRRALYIHSCAQTLAKQGGQFPREISELKKLPSIGSATAGGIRAFAFGLPAVYLETNVRSVFLHEFFPEAQAVPDKVLIPYIEQTCPVAPLTKPLNPRSWYYALLDVGAQLKKEVSNPTRRSKTYTKQSKFEGSHRQKRAEILRFCLSAHGIVDGLILSDVHEHLNEVELKAGRNVVDLRVVGDILDALVKEGFLQKQGDLYRVTHR